ncbi:DUF3841 domain-containing protein [Paenibacillus sp. Y5S-9]|uniref:DUF3841 domain-containing protein n=1 Tax=Paenibacillus sp. Y5S-9 TaxID=3122489 RepID=UPI0030D14CA6
MIYWSMQTLEVWKQAQETGYLEGSSEHLMFPKQYIWMMEQMKTRLPNYKGEYPIWLWIKKPDMRSTAHFEGGTKCVRLTIDLKETDVLISDLDRWNLVLNNGFCSDNEHEEGEFNKGILEMTKEESWERIFDLNRAVDVNWTGNGAWLQGTTGRIYLEKVKRVEQYISRKSKLY